MNYDEKQRKKNQLKKKVMAFILYDNIISKAEVMLPKIASSRIKFVGSVCKFKSVLVQTVWLIFSKRIIYELLYFNWAL